MMRRYVQAFFKALAMTLRGEKPVANPRNQQKAALNQWVVNLGDYASRIERLATQQNLNTAEVVVRIDRQSMSMKMLIELLKFRAGTEYPNLLHKADKSGLSVIYTTNINDQHYITRLHDALDESTIKSEIAKLKAHLEQVPLSPQTFS